MQTQGSSVKNGQIAEGQARVYCLSPSGREQVLELVVEKTRHLAGGEVVVLCLLDPSGEALTVAATSGPAEVFVVRPPAAIHSNPKAPRF